MVATLRLARIVVTRVLEVLVVIAFVALTLDVLWGVFSRYVLREQSKWTDEAATLLMVWVALIGAALAYAERSHLGLDILERTLDSAAARLMRCLAHVGVAVFAIAIMTIGGWYLASQTWQAEQWMPALGIRKAWMYIALPISGITIAGYALEAFVEEVAGKSPDLADESRSIEAGAQAEGPA